MKNLRDITYEELVRELGSSGEKPYRAMQIYRWLYKKGAVSFDEMTDISEGLRQRLKERFSLRLMDVVAQRISSDGTMKFALRLHDGLTIEFVIIPGPKRTTLCISSQAGCALGCAFCMTGEMGFERNLTLSEFSAQVLRAKEIYKDQGEITNVVLMGMGEPLLNIDEVLKFLKILVDHNGFSIAPRRITVSTAGIVPAFEKLRQCPAVNLAISLNATTDEVRSRIMHINKKYPL
ncbi:MAG: 23S rRNA (adenine(2503)-C(2))-methyltransferase RlmN, partial [Deltaproteobacteria bacterium]|nr:23S rRNA (adenine(2503)-C(2))-methyltransferase RlmN [Deltaproteobacteria bacterium]